MSSEDTDRRSTLAGKRGYLALQGYLAHKKQPSPPRALGIVLL